MTINPVSEYDRRRAESYFRKLMAGNEPFELTKPKKKRTLPQNALFHVWCQVIADYVGYTSVEKCKRDIKRKILGMKTTFNRLTGEEEKDDYHTSEMTVEEMSSFMDIVKAWADTELGCYLPYYGDPGYEEMTQGL